MGNTPTQQPFEGDSSDADESGAGASVRETVVGFVRSTLDSVRRRLSVFQSLNLASAFVVEESGMADSRRLRPADRDETTSDDHREPQTAFPERSIPFVQPARDTGRENEPDLEATAEDGQLSIYYPDRVDARIESDTWEDVER